MRKVTGNRINSVNTYQFFRERTSTQKRIFGGLINRVPILWKQKLQISDEKFSMSQIFGSFKNNYFQEFWACPKTLGVPIFKHITVI